MQWDTRSLWFVITYEHFSPTPVEDNISEILPLYFFWHAFGVHYQCMVPSVLDIISHSFFFEVIVEHKSLLTAPHHEKQQQVYQKFKKCDMYGHGSVDILNKNPWDASSYRASRRAFMWHNRNVESFVSCKQVQQQQVMIVNMSLKKSYSHHAACWTELPFLWSASEGEETANLLLMTDCHTSEKYLFCYSIFIRLILGFKKEDYS